jgi:hypothetical protein
MRMFHLVRIVVAIGAFAIFISGCGGDPNLAMGIELAEKKGLNSEMFFADELKILYFAADAEGENSDRFREILQWMRKKEALRRKYPEWRHRSIPY